MSIDRAIRDARNIVTKGGFNVLCTITPPPPTGQPATAYEVNAITSRHNIEFDQDGVPINGTNSHVLFSENELKSIGLTTRNAKGFIALDGWLISFTDGTGTSRSYKIVQTRPSETLGLIVCTLGNYGTN